MKKLLLIVCTIYVSTSFAQDHFAGINTSSRVGILNGSLNPAELANLTKKFEVNVFGVSVDVANNKVGFSDLNSNSNLENLIFTGTEPVNMRFDGEILGPGVAMKWMKWGFAVTTKAHANFNVIDVDPAIGDAIANNNLIFNTTILNSSNNQRLNGVAYGEVDLSAARNLFENEQHSFSAGLTLKVLFPGSYSNFGLDNLNGQITKNLSGAYLTTNSPATLNIAYSGNLADSFTNFNDYGKSIFGSLNGMAADIGFNYRWKGGDKEYKINSGLSIRNMGSMTFKDSNNQSTNYVLNIPSSDPLDLQQFSNVNNLREVEAILLADGYLTKTSGEKDFKVKLPTVISLYADVKIIPKFYVSVFTQQKLNKDENNSQITSQNIVSLTPRFTLGFLEAWSTWSNNEISGFSGGLGFRFYGFYIGSSSILTAVINDSKQADLYTGYRYAFL